MSATIDDVSTVAGATPMTVGDLIIALGEISPDRIRMRPAPGTATEDDLVWVNERKQGICELVDGVIVEKAVGHFESCLAMLLVEYLGPFLRSNHLGFLAGPDGMVRFAPSLVREPDMAVVLWKDVPGDRIPEDAISDVIPALAIEILSRGNTKKEMDRKVREYFSAGVRLVWVVEPRKKTTRVYTSPRKSVTLSEDDVLDGGDVLPGFRLSIREWFGRVRRGGA